MTTRSRQAFTLTDVVILLVLVGLFLAMAGRTAQNANENANRVKCAANLMSIYKGMYLYSVNDQSGNFPRTLHTPGSPPTQYTGTTAANPFGPGGPSANDVTACFFLVIRADFASPDFFVCPSTNYTAWDFGGKTAGQCSNFPGNQNLAYSVANPYAEAAALSGGFKWGNILPSSFVIAGDMNPGGAVLPTLTLSSPAEEMQKGNSKNHGGEGQNVAYGDGHVVFERTPFGTEPHHDCFYTVAASAPPIGSPTPPPVNGPTIVGSPAHYADTVLLPVATIDPGHGGQSKLLIYGVGGVVVLAVIGLVLWFVMKGKAPVTPA